MNTNDTTTPIPTMLWLDDERPAPAGFFWARCVADAVHHAGVIAGAGLELTHASLDHDLGTWEADGGSGAALVRFFERTDSWPTVGLAVHSMNGHEAQKMAAVAQRCSPLPGVPGNRTFGVGPVAGGAWPALPAPEGSEPAGLASQQANPASNDAGAHLLSDDRAGRSSSCDRGRS